MTAEDERTMTEPPFTKAEFEVAMEVIETVRENKNLTDPETKQINDTYHSLQRVGEQYEDAWAVEDKDSVTTPLTLQEITRGTVAEKYYNSGFDLIQTQWRDRALVLGWEDQSDDDEEF